MIGVVGVTASDPEGGGTTTTAVVEAGGTPGSLEDSPTACGECKVSEGSHNKPQNKMRDSDRRTGVDVSCGGVYEATVPVGGWPLTQTVSTTVTVSVTTQDASLAATPRARAKEMMASFIVAACRCA